MKNLSYEVYKSLRKKSSKNCVTDYSLNKPIKISRKLLLVLAITLSKEIKQQSKNSERVGIVIPNSGLGIIANLAVIFAGKIPVNLNFASTNDVARHCIAKSGLRLILTASAVREKFVDFPFPSNTIDCDLLLKKYKKTKLSLIKNYVLNSLPVSLSCKIFNIKRKAIRDEFAVLFTSGSSGAPKGVALSHKNILENINAICKVQNFPKKSKLLANLPLFHSFGFTVTMWLPLLKGIKLVTVPSPLEINKNIKAIENEKVTILLGTPTFLRGYLRKGSSNKFKSIQYVVAGAEKSDIEFIKQWENIAECKYLEGYGLTETSPVISLNSEGNGIQHGSVGRVLPNVMVKTIHPETHETLGRLDTGLLCFRGDNIFMEYIMDADKTKSAFNGDWFVTGDIGRIDETGFLYIEGRLARFSKIGGEMIPHEKIESAIRSILGLDDQTENNIAIVGKPHKTKGEELYLLTTQPINFTELREKLANHLGNLFVPKKHKRVDEIPVLPTGKLDLQKLKQLVN